MLARVLCLTLLQTLNVSDAPQTPKMSETASEPKHVCYSPRPARSQQQQQQQQAHRQEEPKQLVAA